MVKIWPTKKGKQVKGLMTAKVTPTASEAKQLKAGDWYINVHTKKHSVGEVRGQVILPKKG